MLDTKELKQRDLRRYLIKTTDVLSITQAMRTINFENVVSDDRIYRVDVEPPTKIEVICFGIDSLDDGVEGVYDNINDLPNWMQDRLSVLSMLPPNTSGGNDVEGIGRRITESVYWVYAQE